MIMVARLRPSVFWVVMALSVLVSCRSDEPEALEVSCADTVGDLQTDITCYTVTVPADHSEPDGDTLELFVVVVDNPGGEEIGPVAYLVGGPGQAAHLFVHDTRGSHFDAVLVDQRGTGLSKPSLACPELNEITPSLLHLETLRRADALVTSTLADCGSRLAGEGVDVSLFDTESNARDFEVVRTAPGYD
jgi:pimeloyl-ACP methyl ester carboxylesterase